MPVFQPLRASVNDGNLGDIIAATLTTTNSNATVIQSYGTKVGSITYVDARIVGHRTDNASDDGAVLTLRCAYKNSGGTLTQIGTDAAAVAFGSASISASAASSAASGSVIQIKVAGVNGATINWTMNTTFITYAL